MPSTKITIINNTDCKVEIVKENIGKIATIKPQSTWSSVTSAEINLYMHNFFKPNGELLLSGSTRFGTNFGVLVERGWIYEGPQTIKMTAVAKDKEFVQTENGGRPLLNWDEFKDGGEITLTFENI